MAKLPLEPNLTPGERRRVTPQQAKQLIEQGTGTISVKTCFEKPVSITKPIAYELLDQLTDETVALSRGAEPHYYNLLLAA